MSNAYTPILVGVTFSVSEILLLSMGVKQQNWFKQFMQVEVNMECMQTNFGECGFLVLKILFLFNKFGG